MYRHKPWTIYPDTDRVHTVHVSELEVMPIFLLVLTFALADLSAYPQKINVPQIFTVITCTCI